MYKKFFYTIFLVLFVIAKNQVASAKEKILIYADDGYQPYSYIDNGNPAGIYYNILKEAFSKLKDFEVKIEAVPWKRGLAEVESGNIFAIYPPYYRPKERAWMEYSEKILDEKYTLFCRATKSIFAKKNWPEDYKGISVTKNSGFALPKNIMDPVEKGIITLSETKNTQQNLRKLIAHHADCYVNDDIAIEIELAKMKKAGEYKPEMPEEKIIKILDLSQETGFIGFSKKSQSKFPYKSKFIKEFNNIILDMKKNGRVEKIKQNYINKIKLKL
ncbi:substrate-binding periplasmic protein [Fluviispira sanaruensis]|uniref:ABC transporter substrate-binding protein n=1 Tax=Fluviispira sanaruensis TaxID=2493639 RepID=A0A4P2VMR1_FLUSA|nr:transporter substrate-binding domain-containing protein [Fluviispira sanaruensis]BBH53344.1 ABC transporter substrate-binding protein [Fluviispira sanaruensis]